MMAFARRLGLQVSRCHCGRVYVYTAPLPWSRSASHVVAAAPDFTSSSEPPRRVKRKTKPSTDGSTAQQSRALSSLPASKTGQGDADKKQRLSKVMAAAGVAARRPCEELIAKGVVTVNGQLVTSQVLVDPEMDVITVNGKKIDTSASKRKLYHFVVNKPKGYICSNAAAKDQDKQGKRAVDLLQPWMDAWKQQPQNKGQLPPRFFTVGRLDVASTGLLFVTNDGDWANSVIHPSSDITKEYLVLVDRAPSKQQLQIMMRGVEIDGVHVAPEEVSTLEESVRLRVVVKEGKKHEGSLAEGGAQGPAAGSLTDSATPLFQTTASESGSKGGVEGSGRHGRHTGGMAGSHGVTELRPPEQEQDLSIVQPSCEALRSATHTQNHVASPAQQQQEQRQQQPAEPVPRFTASRLIVTLDGVRMWVWDVAAWQLSLALVSQDTQLRRYRPDTPRDPLTGQLWVARASGGRRARGTYKSGAPKRTPVAKRWPHQPLRVVPPSAPNARTVQQWAAWWRARRGGARTPSAVPMLMGGQGISGCDPQRPGSGGLSSLAALSLDSTGMGTQPGSVSSPGAHTGGRMVAGSKGQIDGRRQRHAQCLANVDEVDWKVRLLVAAAELEVLALKRVRVGGFRLPRSLKIGEYQLMTPAQLKSVTDPKAQQSAMSKVPAQQRSKAQATLPGGFANPAELEKLIAGADKSPAKGRKPSRT